MDYQKDLTPLEKAIVAFCNHPPPGRSLDSFGNRVMRFSDTLAVKHGQSLTKHEANNQYKAHQLLDPSVVRVPRVFHFFEHQNPQDPDPTGYILMEYVDGEKLEDLTDLQLTQIAKIIKYMTSFRGPGPAGLMGGPIGGFLFGVPCYLEHGSVAGLNDWVNKRLIAHCRGRDSGRRVDFSPCELVLCHLDIAPRNIIWPKSGPPWLIDWAAAGFVPRLFQFAFHELTTPNPEFNDRIIPLLDPLAPWEEHLKLCFKEAWGNNVRFW